MHCYKILFPQNITSTGFVKFRELRRDSNYCLASWLSIWGSSTDTYTNSRSIVVSELCKEFNRRPANCRLLLLQTQLHFCQPPPPLLRAMFSQKYSNMNLTSYVQREQMLGEPNIVRAKICCLHISSPFSDFDLFELIISFWDINLYYNVFQYY